MIKIIIRKQKYSSDVELVLESAADLMKTIIAAAKAGNEEIIIPLVKATEEE